ncbi:MAG: ATP-binding protein, partial [Planctomycetota bacterium]
MMMTYRLTPEERRALVGRPPTAVQLNEGAYFDRRELLNAAYESFFELATSISRTGVPILILQGLPGTGKSVLLLQLLEHIQAEHGTDFDIELSETGRFTHESFARKRLLRRTIYFVDDLHQYDERGARDALEGAYRAGGSIIVSCGPSKDVEPFLASVGHLVDAIKFDVPAGLSDEDREAATAHFSFPAGAASVSSGTLMEWLFPQAKGNYAAFGGRFRAAIGNTDLARDVLAFAAVDLELPLRLLSDAMRHRLLDVASDDSWLIVHGFPGQERVLFRYRQLAANILQSLGENEEIFTSLMTIAPALTTEDSFSRKLIDRVIVRHVELGFTSPKELVRTLLARFATTASMRGLVFRRAVRTIGAGDIEFAAEVRAYLTSSTSVRDRARFAFWLWTVESDDASVFENLKKALNEDVEGQAGNTARAILTWATQKTRPDDVEARAFDLLTAWAENATGKGIAKEWVLPALFKRLGVANPLADEDAALLRLLKPYLEGQPWTDMGEDVLVALLARTDATSAVEMGLTWLGEHLHDSLGSAVFTAVAGRVRRLDSESPTRTRLAAAANRWLIHWRSDRLSSLWQSVAEAALEVPDRLNNSF